MCGILAYSTPALKGEDLEYFRSAVACRGPDHYGSTESNGITFESSVLSLREPFTSQPLKNESSILCYNGQIYDLPSNCNDTNVVWDICQQLDFSRLYEQEGEFAFVYHTKDAIWFGRDSLGRRSLLYRIDDQGSIIISSVASINPGFDNFIECDGGGIIYKYSMDTKSVERIQLDIPGFSMTTEVTVNRSPEAPIKLLECLRSAVLRRIIRPDSEPGVAVMFSGGLDCTLIASLLDDLLPVSATIDLLNVAFENKRTGTMWDTPDRLLARRSLEELKNRRKTNNVQRFRMIEINVPYETAQQHLPAVKQLMAPCETVIDLSIALAFYFASQPQPEIKSPKILFSGLGADELFAGYSRHTTAAKADGSRLAEELTKDFLRLPHRNLGRDDRVCASWGREVRYPFLDQKVVKLASHLPLNYKTDGEITKIILRDVATLLELGDVVHEKKRAIQFGARSAKMDPGSGRAKGHHLLTS